MENGSIFPYLPTALTQGVTWQRKGRVLTDSTLKHVGWELGKSGSHEGRNAIVEGADRQTLRAPEHTTEKSVVCRPGSPYHKPTQVGEESILRRSSESWSRNSAN